MEYDFEDEVKNPIAVEDQNSSAVLQAVPDYESNADLLAAYGAPDKNYAR